MKKISKILIILITICMLTIASFTKDVRGATYDRGEIATLATTIQKAIDDNKVKDIVVKENLQGYVTSINNTATQQTGNTVEIDEETINEVKRMAEEQGIIKNSTNTNKNNKVSLPEKVNPNDPNSPIRAPGSLNLVYPNDPMYKFYAGLINPKLTAKQISNQQENIKKQMDSTKDPALKVELQKKYDELDKKKSEATVSSSGTAEIPEELNKSINDTLNKAREEESDEDEAEDEDDGLGNPTILKLITGALDGIVGILFWLPKMLLLVTLYTAASIIGAIIGGNFSIESIIFNQAIENPISLISVNFFDKTECYINILSLFLSFFYIFLH